MSHDHDVPVVAAGNPVPWPSPRAWLLSWDWALIAVDLVLVVLFLALPHHEWGQGRDSLFDLSERLTIASWLQTLKLAAIGLLCLVAWRRRVGPLAWAGSLMAGLAACASFVELTRLPDRLGLSGANPAPYGTLASSGVGMVFLVVVLGFLLTSSWRDPSARRLAIATSAGLAVHWLFGLVGDPGVFAQTFSWIGYLLGTSGALLTVTACALGPTEQSHTEAEPLVWSPRVYGAVFMLTFGMVFLQVLLLRMLSIFGSYTLSHSVIAVALIGISVGGLLGFKLSSWRPLQAMIFGASLLPVSTLAAFGAVVAWGAEPLATCFVLLLPFAFASLVITVALAHGESHRVYFVDLVGAACGAVAVPPVLVAWREEGSFLWLAVLGFLITAALSVGLKRPRAKTTLVALGLVCASVLALLTVANRRSDTLNISRTQEQREHPGAQVLYSRSSFVARYDVVRRSPTSKTLKGVENGYTTDTMRPAGIDAYEIDPRLPLGVIKDPTVLIIGLSGDAITKTARKIGSRTVGIELNPALVALQQNELVPFNGDSYRDIEVKVVDGRSFVRQSSERFDYITLMNAHLARGSTSGRTPGTEYLDTKDAALDYLARLTDRGMLDIEEVVGKPSRERPIWKLLHTLRAALITFGAENPEDHFFIFQWRTKTNNYYQIFMKRTPLTATDLKKLREWTQMCVDRAKIEQQRGGERLGPITTWITELYAPDRDGGGIMDHILRGTASPAFLSAHGVRVVTDDRPFLFDVDPGRPSLRAAFVRTLWMLGAVAPFFLVLLAPYRAEVKKGTGQLLVVGLTGLAYFLVELVLIQRVAIYLGSPVTTFATVLATLLLFSGVGSLFSGRLRDRGVLLTMGGLLLALALHAFALPMLFASASSMGLVGRVAVVVAACAPLAFCMGVPFPYIMRMGQRDFGPASAAMLFAANGAASALAVPLALNLSVEMGFSGVMLLSLGLYGLITLLIAARSLPALAWPANLAGVGAALIGLSAPWWLSTPVSPQLEQGQPVAYAVEYGSSVRRLDKVLHNSKKRDRVVFSWQLWLVQDGDQTILIDTGFEDAKRRKGWSFREWRSPSGALGELGVRPEDVDIVVLTHAHWDHMGGLDRYPNARIYIQRAELDWARSVLSSGQDSAKGVERSDLELLERALAAGRVELLDGDHALSDGVRIVAGGAHTVGAQYVEVDTFDGRVILASDNVTQNLNNTRVWPIANATDTDANLRAIEQMQLRAASPFTIIPGHEPRTLDRFPPVGEHAVRLEYGSAW